METGDGCQPGLPGRFSLPLDIELFQRFIERDNGKVLVVSIIGKGKYANDGKASIISQVLDRDVHMEPASEEKNNHHSGMCGIYGHYDRAENIIYLQLESMYDAASIVKLHLSNQLINDQTTTRGSPPCAEHMFARALLFLFSISHIMVLVHPGNSFDATYVKLFRVLDTIRQKLQPSLSDLLNTLPVSRDWMLAGRPCSPRVLFVFESCTLDLENENSINKSRNQKTPPVKRLQHAIEDQVYRILRKARIITNISNNSLFAVPANQEFVYISPEPFGSRDLVAHFLEQLGAHCFAARDSDTPRSRSYQTNRRANSQHNSVHTDDRSRRPAHFAPTTHTFKSFLWQHVELARSKGFDDNVGRNPQPAVFEMPTLETWSEVCNAMYNFFLVDNADSKTRPHFNTLKSLLEVDIRFSEGRCAKVLPIAEGAYQEGLPLHYTKSYHLNKLMAAKRVFQQHARGQATERYLIQLTNVCNQLWEAGRRLCEEVSLTGNHCVNPLHAVGDGPDVEDGRQLPKMAHTSQVKTKAVCNCGRKQAEKDDPFDHKAANYDFYEKMVGLCCANLDVYKLPVFEPSTTDIKPAIPQYPHTASQSSDCQTALNMLNKTQPTRKDSTSTGVGMSNLSLALSLDQSEKSAAASGLSTRSMDDEVSGATQESDFFEGGENTENHEGEEMEPQILSSLAQASQVQAETLNADSSSITTSILPRQHSTTEYLPTMLHTKCPVGLLPKFPSWSLRALAKYSSYSPTQGLDQPGFLHGTNFLLPHDMGVAAEPDKWPVVGDSKKGKVRRIQRDLGDSSARVYLGNEYECPRGHRFFLNGPEKILKVQSGGVVKETAHKVLTSDMPLYFPCQCRSPKGFMAQLMRVYVAVPETAVSVSIKPLVQPGPPPCPLFHPGLTDPIPLTNGHIWVLRLPHIYVGDHGAYRMPRDQQSLSACRVPRGFYQIHDAAPTNVTS